METKIDMAEVLGDPAPETKGGFEIPQEYSDRPWAKSVDSLDSLLKQFDNAQSLIGKKTIGVPADDAPKEEWEAFYAKMGRPEKPDAYEFDPFEPPQDLPEAEQFKRTPEEEALLKDIFHKAGLTKSQAKAVLKLTDEAFVGKQKEAIEAAKAQKEAQDKEFVDLATKAFGEKKSEAIAVTEALLKKYVPQGFEDHIRGLDNNSMIALASVLYKVHQETKGEGSFDKDGTTMSPPTTPADLRNEARKIMADPGYKDPFNKNQANMVKKVKDLYAEAQRLESMRRS